MYGFKLDFIKWIHIIKQNQESCVINGGTTTNYFKLNRCTKQGILVSAYIFIVVWEISFLFIIYYWSINGLNIFEKTFLYTVYESDTKFFLIEEKFLIELMKTFDIFSTFSWLKSNISNCEIASLGALWVVKLALCGMQCMDLMFNTIKILGVYYPHDKNLEN